MSDPAPARSATQKQTTKRARLVLNQPNHAAVPRSLVALASVAGAGEVLSAFATLVLVDKRVVVLIVGPLLAGVNECAIRGGSSRLGKLGEAARKSVGRAGPFVCSPSFPDTSRPQPNESNARGCHAALATANQDLATLPMDTALFLKPPLPGGRLGTYICRMASRRMSRYRVCVPNLPVATIGMPAALRIG
ncbi:hypothetical protein GGTG_12160 [Gaeumannomyces tritici R3-111a-1]|uniref:Uncharacterized protein n=1 Tax=Gaeumannomyces tritici (strain R3-111a-1) TaxID=644352 RepID=J3PF81_GAET3|nr:hypothetical protein GGTG_12160 [Gaeumannomyces tritici R3-111a-1]EJT69983.1 hypothetical protein GGTG_12160 [Gaeumannomyces tritici R3-111a-1]